MNNYFDDRLYQLEYNLEVDRTIGDTRRGPLFDVYSFLFRDVKINTSVDLDDRI